MENKTDIMQRILKFSKFPRCLNTLHKFLVAFSYVLSCLTRRYLKG